MNDRISARWNVVISFICYLVGAPLLTLLISPSGVGGVLYVYPLYTITWLWGKKRGFVAAALGVVLNLTLWIVAGNGYQRLSYSGISYFIVVLFFVASAMAIFVLFIDNMKKREEQQRQEILRSQDLLRLSDSRFKNLI